MNQLKLSKVTLKEVFYIYLCTNILVMMGLAILYYFYVSDNTDFSCYVAVGTYPNTENCTLLDYLLELSVGYVFILVAIQIIIAPTAIITYILRALFREKTEEHNSMTNYLLTTIVFIVVLIPITLLLITENT